MYGYSVADCDSKANSRSSARTFIPSTYQARISSNHESVQHAVYWLTPDELRLPSTSATHTTSLTFAVEVCLSCTFSWHLACSSYLATDAENKVLPLHLIDRTTAGPATLFRVQIHTYPKARSTTCVPLSATAERL